MPVFMPHRNKVKICNKIKPALQAIFALFYRADFKKAKQRPKETGIIMPGDKGIGCAYEESESLKQRLNEKDAFRSTAKSKPPQRDPGE